LISKKIYNKRFRLIFFKNEKTLIIYKLLQAKLWCYNKLLIKYLLIKKKSILPIKIAKINYKLFLINANINSKVKVTNRCLLTNRNRGNYRKYNISRNIYLKSLKFGIIPGFKKAAW
jgi:ribosomal protein S14